METCIKTSFRSIKRSSNALNQVYLTENPGAAKEIAKTIKDESGKDLTVLIIDTTL